MQNSQAYTRKLFFFSANTRGMSLSNTHQTTKSLIATDVLHLKGIKHFLMLKQLLTYTVASLSLVFSNTTNGIQIRLISESDSELADLNEAIRNYCTIRKQR